MRLPSFPALTRTIRGDLDLFMKEFYYPESTDYTPIVYKIDGADLNQMETGGLDANFELHGADLDFEFAVGLVHPMPVNYYQVGRPDGLAAFDDFLDAIDGSYCSFEGGDSKIYDDPNFPKSQCGAFPQSKVLSTSYGADGGELTSKYAHRQCKEYAKLGMMGITFLYSAGDYGVGQFDGCIDPKDRKSRTDGTSGLFTPGFPADCPYVTTVGGTILKPGASVDDPEVVANVEVGGSIYAGAGGFSWDFSMPSYQKFAVDNWINTYSSYKDQPSKHLYQSNGNARGFPDLSANSFNYTVAIGVLKDVDEALAQRV